MIHLKKKKISKKWVRKQTFKSDRQMDSLDRQPRQRKKDPHKQVLDRILVHLSLTKEKKQTYLHQ